MLEANKQELHEFSRQMEEFAEAGIQMEWLVLKEAWEPLVLAELEALVGQAEDTFCGTGQPQAENAGAMGRAAARARCLRHLEPVLQERLTAAKALLAEMVREDIANLGGIITINGLICEPPRIEDPSAGPAWADALAGGRALEEAVRKSTAEFVARALAEGDEGGVSSLKRAAAWWRGQLKTITATVLHAVYNRTHQALSQRL